MFKTNIEFINHASVLIHYNKIRILSDPWYTGTVFHNGWRLLHEIEDSKIINILNQTTHIYISHEHPDHFSPPFFLNKKIKNILISKKIEILFQHTKDKRVYNFLKKQGFMVKELDSGKKMKLGKDVEIQVVKHDFYDSSIIVKTPDARILNLNDCPLRDPREISKFKKKYGTFDVLFSQFSYAAWKGGVNNKNFREDAAEEKLKSIEAQASILKCKSVIPFASFVYFSNELNFYMNDAINTPEKVKNRFINNNFDIVILSPEEIQEAKHLKQNQSSLDFWKGKYENINKKSRDKFEKNISFNDLKAEFQDYKNKIFKKNSKFLILLLKKVKIFNLFQSINIRLLDHNKIYKYSVFDGLIEIKNVDSDVSMHSQSLSYIFKNEFGFDTLTVNGCFECSQTGFSKLAKIFSIGSLNALGLSFNLGLIAKPQIILLFFIKLKKVLKKLI